MNVNAMYVIQSRDIQMRDDFHQLRSRSAWDGLLGAFIALKMLISSCYWKHEPGLNISRLTDKKNRNKMIDARQCFAPDRCYLELLTIISRPARRE